MAMCKREEGVNVCVRMYVCVCTGMYVSVYLYTNDLKRLPTSMLHNTPGLGNPNLVSDTMSASFLKHKNVLKVTQSSKIWTKT